MHPASVLGVNREYTSEYTLLITLRTIKYINVVLRLINIKYEIAVRSTNSAQYTFLLSVSLYLSVLLRTSNMKVFCLALLVLITGNNYSSKIFSLPIKRKINSI